MTKAVTDDGGSSDARIFLAFVTSTWTSACIGAFRFPARNEAVTRRRSEGKDRTFTRRGRSTSMRQSLARIPNADKEMNIAGWAEGTRIGSALGAQ